MKKQKGTRHLRRARKRAKRTIIAAAGKMGQPAASLSPVHRARNAAATSGVNYCMITREIFDVGIGNLILGRTISPYTVALGVFLVDVHCLGIKNAFYAERSHEELRDQINAMADDAPFVDIAPECARKIVDGAIAYAGSLGFSPHPDYFAAEALFGDIEATHCLIDYEFGLDGKPMYVSGPNDTPAKIRKVMQTLATSAGEGNFDYVVKDHGTLMRRRRTGIMTGRHTCLAQRTVGVAGRKLRFRLPEAMHHGLS